MAEETIESLTADLAAARARIKELNDESAGHRRRAKEAEDSVAALKQTHADDLKGYGEKLTAAEKAAQEAGEKAAFAHRDAALRMAAKDAGIVDLDGLKLLDTSAVTVGDDGVVAIPPKFFEQAKQAKPYLFQQQVGTQTGTTASTARTPDATDTGPKHASKMTDAEYIAAKAAVLHR